MVRAVHLIDDTNDLRVVITFADYLARIAALYEKRRIYDRYLEIRIDDRGGFLRPFVGAYDEAGNGEARKVASDTFRLMLSIFREPANRTLANMSNVQYRLTVTNQVEASWPHEEQYGNNDAEHAERAKERRERGEEDRRGKHDIGSIPDVLHYAEHFPMSSKSLIWGGMFVGSTIGGSLPYFWNGDFFAYSLWSALGGFAGIYVGFKLAKATGVL